MSVSRRVGWPMKACSGHRCSKPAADLGEFAFGGPGICDPCFSDGSINVPLRRADGALEKGMAGSLNPAADPVGRGAQTVLGRRVDLRLRGRQTVRDGRATKEASPYMHEIWRPVQRRSYRRCRTGHTMTGGGIAELDISSDGSHVLVGKQVGVDAAGNKSYDLYMHVAGAPNRSRWSTRPAASSSTG